MITKDDKIDLTDPKKTFSRKLSSILANRNISRKVLSDKTGLSHRIVETMLSANNPSITIENAVKVARFLGVSLDYLTGLNELSSELSSDEILNDPGFQTALKDAIDKYIRTKGKY